MMSTAWPQQQQNQRGWEGTGVYGHGGWGGQYPPPPQGPPREWTGPSVRYA